MRLWPTAFQWKRLALASVLLALCAGLYGAFNLGTDAGAAKADTGTLIFAIDLIRHGDRSPITPIPNAPDIQKKWPQGPGQLSADGMQQEFQLGELFRKRYVTESHLLPEQYLAETVYVRSTDIDRTLMSAECALMGLYPPGDGPLLEQGKPPLPYQYQPIPIHTSPKDQDSVLVPDSKGDLGWTVDRFSKTTPEWKQHEVMVASKVERWNQLLGTKIGWLAELSGVGDSVHICQLHHVPLPKDLTDEDIKEIIAEGEFAFAAIFRPKQVGDLTSHDLLNLIDSYIKQASEHKTKLKFVLLSAHDSTIAGIMSAMGDPMYERPPYASDLNFQLFQEGDKFTIKVRLNEEPVALAQSDQGVVSLAQFDELVKASTPNK